MLHLGQENASTAPSFITSMPAGVCSLTLVAGSAVTVTAVRPGTPGTAVAFTTGSGGASLPAGVMITYVGFTGSSGADLYALTASGTTAVSYHLSTPS